MNIIKKVEMGAIIGLVVFVIVRAIPVWLGLRSYGVNIWIFLFLDIITIWPWVKSVSGILQSLFYQKPFLSTVVWGGVAVMSFSAPYIYLYVAGGKQFPLVVKVFIAVIVLLLAFQAIFKIWKKKQMLGRS